MSVSYDSPIYLESVYEALFTLLMGATFGGGITLNTAASRRTVSIPDEIPVADQPCLLLFPGPLHGEQKHFALECWRFTAMATIYARASSEVIAPQPLPASVANYLIWGIAQALAPLNPPYQKQTLGGLVYHAWIEGEVESLVSQEQMVITIPIYMIAGDVG